MKALIALTALMLTGCSSMKPVDACLKTGVLMDLVKLDVCATIGDGRFDPDINVETPDAVDEAADA